MHGVHSDHNQNVHYVVGVQIIVQASGKPLFRNMHCSDRSAKYWNAVLSKKKEREDLMA